MGKLGKILKAIGRFVNGAIRDMVAVRSGDRMSAGGENRPPDWERKDLGI